MTKNSDISLEIRGEREEIAVIRLTRPAKRNALNRALFLALRGVRNNQSAILGPALSVGDREQICSKTNRIQPLLTLRIM